MEKKHLTIAVLGMGYVGCVTAACLASEGHRVIGVDVSEAKVKALEEGKTPIEEPELGELVRRSVQEGLLCATRDVERAVLDSDVSLICVGTPSQESGHTDLRYVERVSAEIGKALARRGNGHVVVLRSTCPPGTMEDLVRPTLEKHSGKKCGEHFFTVFNPEFLREGTAINDYRNPPKVVVGTDFKEAADVMKALYGHLPAPFIVTGSRIAELVKYADNAWHALKITFGNEMGEICRQAGIDSHAVMEIFLQDLRLNISPAYLRPGFAFGGSCLPKDLRALTYFARHRDVSLPVIEHIMTSNTVQIDRVLRRILATGARRVGLYGLTFKPNTDDMRESPFVSLAEALIGKGIEIRIFDENIQLEKLTGANKAYIDQHLPHMMRYLVKSFDGFNDFAELVVIGHRSQSAAAWARSRESRIKLLDLARIPELVGSPNYEGVSW